MRFLNPIAGVTSTGQITSTVTTGTSPLVIASTTVVTNLNADLLDGQQGSYYLDRANHTGSITVASGGTGISSYTIGDIIYASGTTTLSKLADVATGNVLISGGVGVAPSWGKVGLTTHVSGTLAATSGGTGQATYAVGDLLYGTASNTLSKLAAVATGNALISGGVTTAPSWGKIGLTTHVSGTLPIANGGTNSTSTPSAGTVAYGTGSAFGFTAVGTSGQPLVSAGVGAPVFSSIQQDMVVSPLKKKVRVATTANITLSGTQTIDGVALNTNDRVLVKDQTTQSANGIYVVASGAWSRAADATPTALMSGANVVVDAGTANAGKTFSTNFSSTDTLDTTPMFWVEEDPVGEICMWSGAATGGSAPFYTSLPAGFALCDGSAISRTTYAKLFAVIGTRYGTGNGSSTFNLPDMTASLPLGTGTGGAVGNTTYTSSTESTNHSHDYLSGGSTSKTSTNQSSLHTHTINATVVMFMIRYA